MRSNNSFQSVAEIFRKLATSICTGAIPLSTDSPSPCCATKPEYGASPNSFARASLGPPSPRSTSSSRKRRPLCYRSLSTIALPSAHGSEVAPVAWLPLAAAALRTGGACVHHFLSSSKPALYWGLGETAVGLPLLVPYSVHR